MKRHTILTIFTITLLSINQLNAQNLWTLELRPAVNFATQDLGDNQLNTGFGFEAVVSYNLIKHLSAYAGWGWNQFSAEESYEGSNFDFEETGYTFGLKFIHPIGESNIKYLVAAGGIYNHIEIENENDIISDTGHGLGWQVEAGLAIPITDRLDIIPSLRYRSLARDIDYENYSSSVELNYISFGVGVAWSF